MSLLFLLLCKEVFRNTVAPNSKQLLSHRFWNSRIQKHFLWVICLRVAQEVSVKMPALAAIVWRLGQTGESVSQTACTRANGYGQDASGPSPADLSASFLSALKSSLLASSQSDPSKTARQRKQRLLWPSLGRHTPSFPRYPTSYRGQLYSVSEGTTHQGEHQE